MKRILTTLFTLAIIMTGSVPALAAGEETSTGQSVIFYPISVEEYTYGEAEEPRINKVYQLSLSDDPSGIPTEDFVRNGRQYYLLDMTRKNEVGVDTKPHIETVTQASSTDDTGLCMAFNGGSSAFLAPLCSGITQMFNVKVTLFSCGIVCAVICIVCGLGMKSAPVGYVPVGYVQPSSGAALSSQYESYPISRAWRTRQFWLQLGAQAFFPAFYLIMFSRFSMFMTDKGIDLAYATLGVSLYNVGNVVGRLLLGKLTDNIGYKKVYLCCWALCMICGICLLTGSSVAMILIAYICLGAGFGATNSVYPVMTNTSFGPVYAGNIYGFALLGYMVMTQVIPIVTNATITSTGGYTTAFILAFVLCTLGAVCGVLIPKLDRPRLKEATESEKE